MPKLLGLTQSSFDPASRFRFIQFIPYLKEAGWDVTFCPNRPDRQWRSPLSNRIIRGIHYRAGRFLMKINRFLDMRRAAAFDVVFMNRDLAGPGIALEKWLFENNPRVIFDFDDAIFIGGNEVNVRKMCQQAAWVTPGNEYLADYARQYNPRVTVTPTVVDTEVFFPKNYQTSGPENPVKVGWMGSDQSIRSTLFPYLQILRQIQESLPFELVIVTNTRPSLPVSGLHWSFWEWRGDKEADYAANLDIGIMPLVDDEFQKGKCGLKLIQYMAAGIPAVASPVGVNKEILQPGVTGSLASTEKEWQEALECLIRSPHRRAEMGLAARKRCEEHYSIHRWLPPMLEIFEKVGSGKVG